MGLATGEVMVRPLFCIGGPLVRQMLEISWSGFLDVSLSCMGTEKVRLGGCDRVDFIPGTALLAAVLGRHTGDQERKHDASVGDVCFGY